jgi:hypothetical protein
MTGKKWTTEEQDGFLDRYHTHHLAAQVDGNYRKFWLLVHEVWFTKYPEIEMVFSDKSATVATDLTKMEKDSLKNVIQKRQLVSLDPVFISIIYITVTSLY